LTQEAYLKQGSPDDIREWEECHRPRGLWEHAAGDAGGGVAAAFVANVMSVTVRDGTMAAFEADRAGTSAPPTTRAEDGDLGASAL
jgi:hypothetical protein